MLDRPSVSTFYRGDFRIAFRLCFKGSPSAKPFMWKLVLFTCTWTKLCIWVKLISIWKASHQDSLWNRSERQLGNRLILLQMVPKWTERRFTFWPQQTLQIPSDWLLVWSEYLIRFKMHGMGLNKFMKLDRVREVKDPLKSREGKRSRNFEGP